MNKIRTILLKNIGDNQVGKILYDLIKEQKTEEKNNKDKLELLQELFFDILVDYERDLDDANWSINLNSCNNHSITINTILIDLKYKNNFIDIMVDVEHNEYNIKINGIVNLTHYDFDYHTEMYKEMAKVVFDIINNDNNIREQKKGKWKRKNRNRRRTIVGHNFYSDCFIYSLSYKYIL